jgi:outer membrane immunogenic protein
MAKLLLSAAVAALFTSGAMAADLPSYEAPPVVAPVPDDFSWTGIYVGLQAGYAWGDLEANTIRGNNEDEEYDAEGVVGGIFLGYNYELNDSFLLGIEGDFEGTGIDNDDDDDDDDNDRAVGIDSYNADVNWQASVRGRVGFTVDRFLVYGTGGVAFADFDTEFDGNGNNNNNDDDDDDGETRAGWTAGAGVDFAFTDNIFVRGEYRYADLGDFDDDEDNGFGEVQDLETHTVRGGVGFKF